MPNFKISGNKVKTEINLVVEKMMTETNYLLDSLEHEIKENIAAGFTKKQAKKLMMNDFAKGKGITKAWFNKQNKILAEMEKNIVSKPTTLYAKENPKTKFAWVLGSVKTSHCPDCLRLSSMEPRTISEWRKLGLGLPREGLTACNVGCQCMLEEEAAIAKKSKSAVAGKNISGLEKVNMDKEFDEKVYLKEYDIYKKKRADFIDKNFATKKFKAVSFYKGNGYRNINELLRYGESGKNIKKLSRENIEDLREKIKLIRSSLTQKLNKDTVLWRGGGQSDAVKAIFRSGRGKGKVFEDKGFVSSTINRNVMNQFAREHVKEERVIVKINAKAGTKCAAIDVFGYQEQEYLIPDGAIFKINRMGVIAGGENEGALFLDVDLIKGR